MAEKAKNKTAQTSSPPAARDTEGLESGESDAMPASMIDDVRQFVELMIDSGLGELDVRDGGRRIHLKRQDTPATAALPGASPGTDQPVDRYTPAQEADAAESGLTDVISPMVGTLYTAASPDSDPFVAVGDAVGDDDVVCIIEAMKVMNEIRADCAGTIAEICIKNAQPVEFGQKLFRVKTA